MEWGVVSKKVTHSRIQKSKKESLGRVCKVQNMTVGVKHLYLDVWLQPEFCVQMLTLLTSKRANANAFTEESRQALVWLMILAVTQKQVKCGIA